MAWVSFPSICCTHTDYIAQDSELNKDLDEMDSGGNFEEIDYAKFSDEEEEDVAEVDEW